MNNTILAILSVLLYVISPAQQQPPIQFVERENGIAISAGMGVNLVAASALTDYVNRIAVSTQRVDDFISAVEFFGGVEFPLNDKWGIKIVHSYLFRSYNLSTNTAGNYLLNYNVHAPLLLLQRVYSGKGYFLKLNGGAGYHFASGNEQFSAIGTDKKFSARGVGIRFEANGQTAFDEYLFGCISGGIGYEFLGALRDENNNELRYLDERPTLNYFFIGLQFGLIYYF